MSKETHIVVEKLTVHYCVLNCKFWKVCTSPYILCPLAQCIALHMLSAQQLFATNHNAIITLQSFSTDSFFPSLYKTTRTSLLKPIIFTGEAAFGASVTNSANDRCLCREQTIAVCLEVSVPGRVHPGIHCSCLLVPFHKLTAD